MSELKLFMVLLGCKPEGRFTEQHDIFFGVGASLKDLEKAMIASWPEAKGKIHIDAWRMVEQVDGYKVIIQARQPGATSRHVLRLFFLNLGGYKKLEFEEYHYKMLVVSTSKADAIARAKLTAFYKHTGFKGASSHIDDQYGIDVDDIYRVEELLPTGDIQDYQISLVADSVISNDVVNLGYLTLQKMRKSF